MVIFLTSNGCIISTTFELASRFRWDTARVRMSSVVRQLECRNNSWATLMPTPSVRRFVASEWRKLCQPICLSTMPARTGAGRILFCGTLSGRRGLLFDRWQTVFASLDRRDGAATARENAAPLLVRPNSPCRSDIAKHALAIMRFDAHCIGIKAI